MQVQTVDAAVGIDKVRVEVLEDGNNSVFALADTRSVQVELLRKRDNFRLSVNGFMAFAELPQLTHGVVSLPAAIRYVFEGEFSFNPNDFPEPDGYYFSSILGFQIQGLANQVFII